MVLDYILARLNVKSEEGQTMAEYAVVLAVITLVVVAALVALSGGIEGALNQTTDEISGATTS